MSVKFIILLCSFLCVQSYAYGSVKLDTGHAATDTTDLAAKLSSLRNETAQLQDSIIILENIRYRKENENIDLQSGIISLKNSKQTKFQLLQDAQNDYLRLGVGKLKAKQDVLRDGMDKLRCDIEGLNNEIETLNDEIALLQSKKDELDDIKDKKTSQLLDEYESYLDMSLKSISIDTLTAIINVCKDFIVDSKIKSFVLSAEQLLQSKQVYDRANQACNSKYDEISVKQSLAEISSLEGLNPNQQQEVNEIGNQLDRYYDGIVVFKEIINRINAKRIENYPRYSSSSFMDDLPFILKGLEEKIEYNITPVKYLNEQYAGYMDIIKSNPMQHPAIEQEILDL